MNFDIDESALQLALKIPLEEIKWTHYETTYSMAKKIQIAECNSMPREFDLNSLRKSEKELCEEMLKYIGQKQQVMRT